MPKINYDDMTKEELISAIKKKGSTESYKWRKSVILTPAEGEELEEEILPSLHCNNASQLLKRIVHGEIVCHEKHQ